MYSPKPHCLLLILHALSAALLPLLLQLLLVFDNLSAPAASC
jgi:hypothetical protein